MALPGWGTIAGFVAVAILLGACAAPPRHPVARPVGPPPPSTRVYAYPMAGQNVEQQDRDRFECHQWAVKQTGFDPGLSRPLVRERVEPVPPSGSHAAAGAVAGAAVGAVIAPRHERVEGAVVGAVAGAAVGAVSDASRQEQSNRIQERLDAQAATGSERHAQDFRRAMAACMEARGYSVR